jgi:hypothetical protein
MSFYILKKQYYYRESPLYTRKHIEIHNIDGSKLEFETRDQALVYIKETLGYTTRHHPTQKSIFYTNPQHKLRESEYNIPELYIRKRRIYPEGWMPNKRLVEDCKQFKDSFWNKKIGKKE